MCSFNRSEFSEELDNSKFIVRDTGVSKEQSEKGEEITTDKETETYTRVSHKSSSIKSGDSINTYSELISIDNPNISVEISRNSSTTSLPSNLPTDMTRRRGGSDPGAKSTQAVKDANRYDAERTHLIRRRKLEKLEKYTSISDEHLKVIQYNLKKPPTKKKDSTIFSPNISLPCTPNVQTEIRVNFQPGKLEKRERKKNAETSTFLPMLETSSTFVSERSKSIMKDTPEQVTLISVY